MYDKINHKTEIKIKTLTVINIVIIDSRSVETCCSTYILSYIFVLQYITDQDLLLHLPCIFNHMKLKTFIKHFYVGRKIP